MAASQGLYGARWVRRRRSSISRLFSSSGRSSPCRRVKTISSGVSIAPSEMCGWLPAKVSSRRRCTRSRAGTDSRAASAPTTASSRACIRSRTATASGLSCTWSAGRTMPTFFISSKVARNRCWRIEASVSSRASSGWSGSISRIRSARAPGSKARVMASSTSSSLDSTTRKIVPSATPAASAIWRVVTARPCSRSRLSVVSIELVETLLRRHRPGALAAYCRVVARRTE